MSNEVQRKYRSAVSVQASAAIVAGAFSAGDQTSIDNTPTGNGAGADEIQLTLDVTGAPAAAAKAEIYMSTSEDGTNWTNEVLITTIDIETVAQDYQAGIVYYPRKHTKYLIKAIDYGFTAALNGTPVLPEVQ